MFSDPKLRLLVRHSDSPKDLALAEELLGHLKPLERFANVDVWSVHRIRAGEETRREVERAIDQADVLLLLLSADFFGSDTLLDVEVPKLMERHRQGSLKVVPVLLRSCHWEAHPWLAELHPLPRDGKPIASHHGDERDRVLTELVKEIAGFVTPSPSASVTESPRAQAPAAKVTPPTESGTTYNINIHSSTIGGLGVGAEAKVIGTANVGSSSSVAPSTRRLTFSPRARIRLHALLEDAEPEYKRVGGVTSNHAFLRPGPLLSIFEGADRILRRKLGVDLAGSLPPYHDTKDICVRLDDDSLSKFVLAVRAYLGQVDYHALQVHPQDFEAQVSAILAEEGSPYRLRDGTYEIIVPSDGSPTSEG